MNDSRCALVTGGASGLGAVLTRRLRDRGFTVVVLDTAVDADAGGPADGVVLVAGDVTDPSARARAVTAATAGGGLRALVNNAGGWGSAAEQYPGAPVADWTSVLDLNLVAPMALVQECLGPMRIAGGGAVVNVSSSAAVERTAYGSPEYAVAKAGLLRLSTSLAGLATSHGVRVNAVVPGWIGLPRAVEQAGTVSREERPHLVPPGLVADVIERMVVDPAMTGRVCELLSGTEQEWW